MATAKKVLAKKAPALAAPLVTWELLTTDKENAQKPDGKALATWTIYDGGQARATFVLRYLSSSVDGVADHHADVVIRYIQDGQAKEAPLKFGTSTTIAATDIRLRTTHTKAVAGGTSQQTA